MSGNASSMPFNNCLNSLTPSRVSQLKGRISCRAANRRDPWGWSAAGMQVNDRGIVVYNPRHSRGRQVSDITHELAHFILDHQPAKIILSADLDGMSMRSFNQKQE